MHGPHPFGGLRAGSSTAQRKKTLLRQDAASHLELLAWVGAVQGTASRGSLASPPAPSPDHRNSSGGQDRGRRVGGMLPPLLAVRPLHRQEKGAGG